MGNTAGDVYETWDLESVPIPTRSTLYALAPMGVGTAFGECLTSYIARLASAHCVSAGTLLDKIIVPLLPSPSPTERGCWTGRSGFDLFHHPSLGMDKHKIYLINANGPYAIYTVQAIEQLTLRTDPRHLTLLPLGDVLASRGLLRPMKAWCSACYEEWRISGQVIYDPLLWIFQEVTICIRHQRRLSTRCSRADCARLLPTLAWRSRPGYCPFCHSWLGCASPEQVPPLREGELAWQQWATQSLGTVLAILPVIAVPPTRERLSQVLISLVEHVAKGNISAFARTLNTSRTTIDDWYLGKGRPQIALLLRLCYRFSLSLDDVLTGQALQPQFRDDMPPAFLPPRRPVAIDTVQISQSLEQVVTRSESPPPSMNEVARRLGHRSPTLYKINPIACHAIANRYREYCWRLREKRLQGYRDEIRQIALGLQTQGLSLTQRNFARHLIQPAILCRPEVRAFLREVRRELEREKEGSLL